MAEVTPEERAWLLSGVAARILNGERPTQQNAAALVRAMFDEIYRLRSSLSRAEKRQKDLEWEVDSLKQRLNDAANS